MLHAFDPGFAFERDDLIALGHDHQTARDHRRRDRLAAMQPVCDFPSSDAPDQARVRHAHCDGARSAPAGKACRRCSTAAIDAPLS